jgi:hypothetical protein
MYVISFRTQFHMSNSSCLSVITKSEKLKNDFARPTIRRTTFCGNYRYKPCLFSVSLLNDFLS